MSVRRVLAVAGAALIGGFLLAVPVAAHASVQLDPVGAYTMTAGRLWSLVAAVVGLAGVVAGGLALARSTGRIGSGSGSGSGRRGAFVALAAGLAGAVVGGLVVAAAEGGPGTGYGIVGGVMALVVGLIGTALGGLVLVRSRRAG
ncbi:DUF6223 family protein [Streptosporangium sp. NPDC023825]|uniref:DUF6223 family protein n=1 Tax=Streptosporangium sp. NPDC023825 TaxID=3154909 RepID=UPI00341CE54F